MLDPEQSLIPSLKLKQSRGEHFTVLSVGYEEDSLAELERLETTLGVQGVSRVIIKSNSVHPGLYLGKGKAEEVKAEAERLKVDAIVLDVELSPNQLKNLEKFLGKPVLDRPGIILEIFSQHARTKEAKLQVEIARLQYLLPRLTNFWTHLERQRGGIGLKGGGEKQIEVDRRLVKTRIAMLNGRLKEISKERAIQRSGRKDLLKVALVGYTNAGKSTLLNALTHSEVLAEDKLFATLDSSVRLLDPFSKPPIVAIDTVGFIRNLPTALIASFRSTLEELNDADLLLHVVDSTSATAGEEIEVTEGVLKELGLEKKPRMVILNKADLLKTPAEKNMAKLISKGAPLVSSLDPEVVEKIRALVGDFFANMLQRIEVVIPYEDGKTESQIRAHAQIESEKHLEKGIFFRAKMSPAMIGKLKLERFFTGKKA